MHTRTYQCARNTKGAFLLQCTLTDKQARVGFDLTPNSLCVSLWGGESSKSKRKIEHLRGGLGHSSPESLCVHFKTIPKLK